MTIVKVLSEFLNRKNLNLWKKKNSERRDGIETVVKKHLMVTLEDFRFFYHPSVTDYRYLDTLIVKDRTEL